MTATVVEMRQGLIRWRYLFWAVLSIAFMIAAIAIKILWLLNFMHVFSSLLWTGIDLFMGFVLSPILRRVDISVRREIMGRLTSRALFLMPTISIISDTTGWFLAVQFGYTALGWPEYGWVAEGLGFLTPVNVFVCLELQKDNPDLIRISRWMSRYFYAVASQGAMQVIILVIMTRFRIGV